MNLPLQLGDRDAELNARILEASRDAYREQVGGELYIVFHPSWVLNDAGNRRLFEVIHRHLAAAGVPMLDYSRDHEMDDGEVIDPDCDRHPNGRMNAELADLLARHLSARPN